MGPMVLAILLEAAGLASSDYPAAAKIPVTIYDGIKGMPYVLPPKFPTPLFADNLEALEKFRNYVSSLESSPVEQLTANIQPNLVVVRTPSCEESAKIFWRKEF